MSFVEAALVLPCGEVPTEGAETAGCPERVDACAVVRVIVFTG